MPARFQSRLKLEQPATRTRQMTQNDRIDVRQSIPASASGLKGHLSEWKTRVLHHACFAISNRRTFHRAANVAPTSHAAQRVAPRDRTLLIGPSLCCFLSFYDEVRFSRARYLRIGWFAGAKLSTAAFRSECRSREVQGMIVFSPDSLITQRDRIFRILSGRTSFISSQRIRFRPLCK